MHNKKQLIIRENELSIMVHMSWVPNMPHQTITRTTLRAFGLDEQFMVACRVCRRIFLNMYIVLLIVAYEERCTLLTFVFHEGVVYQNCNFTKEIQITQMSISNMLKTQYLVNLFVQCLLSTLLADRWHISRWNNDTLLVLGLEASDFKFRETFGRPSC